ncbi:hypothetical protein [Teredinibacter haidensis]|uniref:hypothetical protein n=1 Tax=Teredinibacter haidensis TaxID=2731755 RepID=UPI000948E84F|nr:hypothetical protein [Teredinibacter haidensis]
MYPKARDYEKESFFEFYRKYLLADLGSAFAYQTCELKTCGCDGIDEKNAKIHVFPNFKWSGSLSLGCSDLTNRNQSADDASWSIKGKIDGSLGRSDWKYEAGTDITLKNLFPKVQGALDDFLKLISDITGKPSKKNIRPG